MLCVTTRPQSFGSELGSGPPLKPSSWTNCATDRRRPRASLLFHADAAIRLDIASATSSGRDTPSSRSWLINSSIVMSSWRRCFRRTCPSLIRSNGDGCNHLPSAGTWKLEPVDGKIPKDDGAYESDPFRHGAIFIGHPVLSRIRKENDEQDVRGAETTGLALG